MQAITLQRGIMKIEVTDNPNPKDLNTISLGIQSFNKNYIGDVATEEDFKFAVFARNDVGKIVGGIRAIAFWNWLYIELLWLKDNYRGTGIGKQLLSNTEEFAVKNNFYRSRLETTNFQALEFYLKQGYEIFGKLDDLPVGHTTYYLKKELTHN